MQRSRTKLSSLAVVVCVIALLASGDLRAKKPTTTITGAVKSAETYRGKVRSVYIEGEDDFLVARGTAIGKELLKQVGATVTATGYVRRSVRDPEFAHVIDILSYEIEPLDESTSGDTDTPRKAD